jgi:aspartate carbamoyltransferase catalytic subunit
MQHLVSIYDLTKSEIELIMEVTKDCQEWFEQTGHFHLKFDPTMRRTEHVDCPYNYAMGSIFCEASTRTRMSFEIAHQKLGGILSSVEDVAGTSSLAKGESLTDTVKTVSQMVDIIVLRHGKRQSAKKIAEHSKVPIINAGDGDGEHPTQALLDFYTIQQRMSVEGKKVFFFGDSRYARTVNSLKALLQNFGCQTQQLDNWYCWTESKSFTQQKEWVERKLEKGLSWCDILYVTRNQVERWEGTKNVPLGIQISHQHLDKMQDHAIVLHPGPRRDEMNPQIDINPKLAMWDQVNNGVYVRMAILKILLGHL